MPLWSILLLLLGSSLPVASNLANMDSTTANNNNNNNNTTSPPPQLPCLPSLDLSVAVDSTWLEHVVFGNFRIWHVLFSGIAVFTVVAVVLCCLFRCRIPRTKQEIEADYIRKKITKSFRQHLDQIKLEELEFDPANMLPVYKKVEVLEESRLHSTYIAKKLTWYQKITKFLTGKEPSISEEEEAAAAAAEAQKAADGTTTKMTAEEMSKVEEIVEGEKTDKSAFNVITDQIAILSFGESKKDKKKREKAERKAEKQRKKEAKEKEKQAKTEAKQQGKQAKLEQKKKTQPLLELDVEKLAAEHAAGPSKDVDTQPEDSKPKETKEIITTVAEIVSVKEEEMEPRPSTSAATLEPVPATIVPTTEDKPREPSPTGFSFRKTVKNLLIFKSKKKPEPAKPAITGHEQMVINIEMVAKHTPPPLEDGRPCPTFVVSMPATEPLSSPSEDDHRFEEVATASQEAINMNLLDITEIAKTTKEVNVQRSKQERKDKLKKDEESRKKKEMKRAKEEEEERRKRERKHDKEAEETRRKMERKRLKEEEERQKKEEERHKKEEERQKKEEEKQRKEEERQRKEERKHAKEIKESKKAKKVDVTVKEEVLEVTPKEDTKKKRKETKPAKDKDIEPPDLILVGAGTSTTTKSEPEKKSKKKKESTSSTLLSTKQKEPKPEPPIEDQPPMKPTEKALKKAVKVDTSSPPPPGSPSTPTKAVRVEEKKKKVRIIENIQLEPKKKKKTSETIQPEVSEPGPSRAGHSKSSLVHKTTEVQPPPSPPPPQDRKKKKPKEQEEEEEEEKPAAAKVAKKHPKKER